MKRKGLLKCLSAVLVLCMILSCISFSFATAGAASVGETSIVSASSTAANDNFTWDNASVYFLLTDRFKNGNTSNDHSYNRGLDQDGNVVTGIDTRGTFHGGDFAGVTQAINEGYFTDLGVNAIWISAPYEQIHGYVVGGNESPSYAHYSYHGYYVLDYTQTDANFGTAEEFGTLVDTAHEHGIRVILDVVMNHSGYNSLYDMDEYGYGTVKPGWESYYFSHQNINNADYHSYIDYDSSAADWANWWGADWIRCGVAGYTQGGGDNLTMSLAGLPDFKTDSTATVGIPNILKRKWTKEGRLSQETNELSSYLSKTGKKQTVTNTISYWLSTWVREYGVDGFRCDTAKHVDLASWKTLKDTCVDALKEWRQNNPSKPGADWDEDFWMTGECWDHNIGWGYDSYYTQGGFDSMINFETQGGGLLSMSGLNGVYSNYASSINSNDKFNQLSYLSSHDSTLARGNLISTGSAFLLLPGGIQIYYGDETNRPLVPGVPNDGNGGAGHSLRSDMNWDSIDSAVLAHWQKVGSFRNKHVSIGAGDHQQISGYSSSTGYTFSRSYDNGVISDNIIATIGAPSNTNLAVDVSSLWSDGTTVTNAYDGTTATVTNGKATFNTGANGTILIEGPVSTISMSLKGSYSFYDSQTLTVSLRGADYAMVSIDGGTEFKVVDGDTFSVGEGIEVGATIKVTMTASNDEETSTKSFTYKKKDPNAVVRVYFDNSKYNWSTVNAYIYDESSGKAVENKAWPGEAMTYDTATGFYMIEVPDNLTNGRVIFNAGKTSSNRYPGDGAQGLAINGTHMLFSYGNKWEPYTNHTPDPTKPTTAPATTVPATTAPVTTAPVTTVPATTAPATTAPVTTVPATTAPVTDELTVTASSNIFPTVTKTFNKDEGTVTVSYKLTANMKAVDTQWTLTYDSTKLEYNISDNMVDGTQTITPSAGDNLVFNNKSNYIKGNFSNLKLVSFDNNADFVSVTFNIIGTGEADVYLDLEILSLGYKDSSNKLHSTSIVDYSKMQDISGVKGFENASISTSTNLESSIIMGDVNSDGYIRVDDVTLILKYVVCTESLNALQIKAADVDGDGKINVKDATLIQKYIAGMISGL